MVDALGWRCKMGLLTVASDIVVQPEYEAMRPVGVTNHVSRIDIDMATRGAGTEEALRLIAGPEMEQALVRVMSPQPDHIVLPDARSLIDRDATTRLQGQIESQFGRRCTTPVEALSAALAAQDCGPAIAVVCGFARATHGPIKGFFEVAGFNVLRITGDELQAERSPPATREDVRQQMLRVDDANVRALVLLGMPLPVGRLCAEAEHWMGKPVISVNTAVYWHALRHRGIADKVAGFGSLLERI